MLFVILIMLILPACTSEEPPPILTKVPPADTKASPTMTSLPPTLDLTADWIEYFNAELGYSFKYPAGCVFGPMTTDCMQNPPEERSLECLCYLNAEDPYVVGMQAFLGNPAEGLSLVTLSVAQHDTSAFNPPKAEEWIPWVNEKWSFLSDDMPDEPNMTLDGLPAARIYEPGSPQAYPAEHVFVLKDGRLIHIYMIDVDVEEHREFYESVLTSFQFSD